MTEDKARKRQIRARMAKTGERYTAARANVVTAKLPPRVADPGSSDASVRKGSGKTWDEWFRILDAWNGTDHTHGEIARHLHEELGVPGWWSQTVTVGYERARGMRAVGQNSNGFCVYASKTVAVDVDRLHRAFADARQRSRWLDTGTLRVRTSEPGRSARFDFQDGSSRLVAWFEAKGPGKSTVHLQHERLAGSTEVGRLRAFWKERLGRLAAMLTG